MTWPREPRKKKAASAPAPADAPAVKIDISISVPGDQRRAAEIAQLLAEVVARLLSPENLEMVRREFAAWRKKAVPSQSPLAYRRAKEGLD